MPLLSRRIFAIFPGLVFLACSAPARAPESLLPPPSPSSPTPAVHHPQESAAASTPSAAPAAASAEATAKAPPSSTTAEAPSCPQGMALVPGGKLSMGVPKHEVSFSPLCLDKNEVTADDYAACVKAGKCTADFLKCAPQATYGVEGKGNHPINCVDFAQATAYCSAQNKRLPTNEEWEFAARGPEGKVYPWGNDKPKGQLCWSGASVLTGTCAVGANPQGDNPQGIHDLAGNVFEWTTSKADTKTQIRDGRGGSWKDGAEELVRASRPGAFASTYRCGFLGIRCAADAPKTTK